MRLILAIRLLRLRFREYVLEGDAEHGEGLMRDHLLRMANTRRELEHVRREIDMIVSPQTIIQKATRRAS